MNYKVLYNPNAGNKRGYDNAKSLEEILKDDELEFLDVTEIEDFNGFFDSLEKEDSVIISGGDGTLNHFINDTEGISFEGKNIFYHAGGSGNDFAKDIDLREGEISPLTTYIENLPKVVVNGKTYRFANGVGFGIDGYCCEEGDKVRANSTKPINYTKIAILGLLFYFKRRKATITVDGVSQSFKDVWLAPTMFGRYYGGGMMPCPSQRRNNSEGTLSATVMHSKSKLRTLLIFPGIFSGAHVKHKGVVSLFKGKEITVTFDRPTPLQIDGETILDVLTYTAYAPNLPVKNEEEALTK